MVVSVQGPRLPLSGAAPDAAVAMAAPSSPVVGAQADKPWPRGAAPPANYHCPMARTVDRGYGQEHKKERAQWQPLIDRGEGACLAIVCLRASRWIRPGEPWDLGHSADRTYYLGPCHVECNRSEGGSRGNARWPKASRARAASRWRPTRQW